MHINTGTNDTGWEGAPVPRGCGGSTRSSAAVDRWSSITATHLFSVGYFLGGPVEKGLRLDRPKRRCRRGRERGRDGRACRHHFKYRADRCYGFLDVEYTPSMRIHARYYTGDDRIEVIGEKGIIFINATRPGPSTLPPLMLFKDGKTTTIPVGRRGVARQLHRDHARSQSTR